MAEGNKENRFDFKNIRLTKKYQIARREALVHLAAEQSEGKDTEDRTELFKMIHSSTDEGIEAVFNGPLGKKLGLVYPDAQVLDEEASRFYFDQLED